VVEETLEVCSLRLSRGDRDVLRDVNLRLHAGQYLEIRGANGAGKTSLLRAIAGLLPIESGSIWWCGQNAAHDRDILRRAMMYLGHDPPLKGDFSAIENLRFWIGLRRHCSASDIVTALRDTGLPANALERPVRTLSAGQRRRVALAGLSLARVSLWLLDEPTTQLDDSGQRLVAEMITRHLAAGGLVAAAMHLPLPMQPARHEQLLLAAA
jgi:heme exporter protein A